MAKKSSRSGSKKHYPVQNQFRLGFNLPSAVTQVHGALDRDLSRINHRLYRQSRYYEMKVDIDADLPDGTIVQVYALQDSWMNQKAYQLAYDMFEKNSQEELEQLGDNLRARWNDFRVAVGLPTGATTSDSTPAGFDGPAAPASPVLYTDGEYRFSEVTDQSGTTRTFRWVGTGAATFNIIDEYDVTGNTNSTPTSGTGTAAYTILHDDIDSDQMVHLSQDGNQPPYAAGTIENQVWMLVGTLHIDATGTSKLSTGYFCAPCGIYALQLTGADGNTVNGKISITAKAGDYKGVTGESMLEL
jgi:hypothetical protein